MKDSMEMYEKQAIQEAIEHEQELLLSERELNSLNKGGLIELGKIQGVPVYGTEWEMAGF